MAIEHVDCAPVVVEGPSLDHGDEGQIWGQLSQLQVAPDRASLMLANAEAGPGQQERLAMVRSELIRE